MKTEKELTPEEMLFDMEVHARSGIVHVEPKMVALWRENIGHVLCAAAFDVGLALVETDDAARADEREACVHAAVAAIRHSQQTTDQCRAEVAAAIRARGAR